MKYTIVFLLLLVTFLSSAQRVTNVAVQCNDSIIRITLPKLTMTNKDSNVTIFQDAFIVERIKRTTGPGPVNQLPVVNAGSNQTITLPVSSVTLNGNATDADGTISSYLWSKVSGGNATISPTNNKATTVSGLSAGNYTFKLEATDNSGGKGSANINVTVNNAPPTGTRQNLIWRSDFETQADLDKWQREVETGVVVRSTEQARAGTYSAKFSIDKSNVPNGQRGRIELKPPHEQQFPSERWYGISVYLPAGYQRDNESESVFQWHNDGGPANAAPNMTMQIVGDQWRLTNASNSGNRDWFWGAVKKGGWTDFIFHIKWNYTSAGLIEVWKDGVKPMPDYNGPTSYNPPARAPYFKVGLHKWTWESNNNPAVRQRTIYLDEIYVGNERATYNDVKAGNY